MKQRVIQKQTGNTFGQCLLEGIYVVAQWNIEGCPLMAVGNSHKVFDLTYSGDDLGEQVGFKRTSSFSVETVQ